MKIGIIGAGGHGAVIGDIAISLGYSDIYYFDDYLLKKNFNLQGKFAGKLKNINQYQNLNFIVGYGDNYKRAEIINHLESNNLNIITLVHPNASVSMRAKIGKGTVVMRNASINNNVKISKGCIINTGANIDHDCIINKFSHICPGVNMAGNVKIGKYAFIGIGSNIIQKMIIGHQVIIGAGSIITQNIKSNVTVYNKKELVINEKN